MIAYFQRLGRRISHIGLMWQAISDSGRVLYTGSRRDCEKVASTYSQRYESRGLVARYDARLDSYLIVSSYRNGSLL